MKPRVLFAHERPGVCRAVAHVLSSRGFDTTAVRSSSEAMALLRAQSFAAFVVDVALPGQPGFELIEPAKALREQGGGAQVVVLVASVFRKTSYKRRPVRLYGADDYVELHHLGDMLPDKLGALLGLRSEPHDVTARATATAEATELVYAEADTRLEEHDVGRLAALIVADMVLYNGDRISATRTVAEARVALRDDLDIARDLMRQVRDASNQAAGESAGESSTDAGAGVDDAFTTLMTSMGRIQESA